VTPRLLIANRLDPDDLSSDPRVGEAYVADPLNQHRSTVDFAHAGFAEQRRVAAVLDRLSIPTLVVHAEADRIVPASASEGLGRLPGVTRRTYPGLRHELHNEPSGHQVVADEIDWIRDRVSRMHPAATAG
jgi:alpha-beta hydrolase superfamily lysophospholipase